MKFEKLYENLITEKKLSGKEKLTVLQRIVDEGQYEKIEGN